jgi:ankyrin repeat protein
MAIRDAVAILVAAVLAGPSANAASAPQDLSDVTKSSCEAIGEYWANLKANNEAGRVGGHKSSFSARMVKSDQELLLLRGVPVSSSSDKRFRARLDRKLGGLKLISASARGDVASVRMLVKSGVDPNYQSKADDWATPLGWAAQCNHPETIRTLVSAGAKVNKQFGYFSDGGHSTTALIWASESGATNAVEVLISLRADLNIRQVDYPVSGGSPQRGVSALDAASKPEIRDLLLRHTRTH